MIRLRSPVQVRVGTDPTDAGKIAADVVIIVLGVAALLWLGRSRIFGT